MTTLYVGACSPERLRLTVTGDPGDFALDTVTSLSLQTESPSGVVVSWSWSIDSQTPTTLVALHTFAVDGSDVPTTGIYTLKGWLVSAGTRRRIVPVTVEAARY